MNRRNAELSMLVLGLLIVLGASLQVDFAKSDEVPRSFFGYGAFTLGLFLVAHVAVRRLAPNADPLLLPIALALAGFGHAMIRRLDADLAAPQLAWLGVGVGVFVITLLVLRDHRSLESYRYSLMLLGIALLLLPLAPSIGRTVSGARLWVRVGALNFQPAEAAKVILAAFLAGYLASKREVMTIATARVGPWIVPAPRHFGPLLLAWGLSLAVMFFERDLGSSLLFFALFVAVLYAATARSAYAVAGLGLFGGGVYLAFSTFAHVRSRIVAWIDPWSRFETAGYQIAQSIFALGTGGMTGVGIGQGRPDFIDPGDSGSLSTDFIFAATGEELGLLATGAILMMFALIVARGFHIALRSREAFGMLLATGLTAIIGIQAFLIMGGVTRLIPLTGITLPFVSYGGSSLVANFALIAVLMRISDAEGA